MRNGTRGEARRGRVDRRRIFWVLFGFQVLLLVVSYALGCVKYEVSDDYVMEMVLSGVYAPGDVHIMFSNVLWAAFLRLFYRLAPNVGWYLLGQAAVCFAAMTALSWLFSRSGRWEVALPVGFIFSAILARDLYLLPQFTKTAAAAMTAGSLLFLHARFFSRSRWETALGALLALLGGWVRLKSVYIVGPFVAVYLVWAALRRLRKGESVGRLCRGVLLPGLLLVALIFGCGSLDKLAYTSQRDYGFYRDFGTVRAKLLDYPQIPWERYREELEATGITENDYRMLYQWSFADPETFDLDTLEKVLEVAQAHRRDLIDLPYAVKSLYWRQLWNYPCAICCLILGVLYSLTGWKRVALPVLLAAILAALCLYFNIAGRMVYRVEFGCFFAAAALLAYCCTQRCIRLPSRELRALLWLGTAASVLFVYTGYTRHALDAGDYSGDVRRIYYRSWDYVPEKYGGELVPGRFCPELVREMEEHPQTLYLMDFNTAIQTFYYQFSPLVSAASCFPDNALFLAGVTEYHPSVTPALESRGVKSKLQALLREDVVLVCSQDEDCYLTWLREHGHARARVETVKVLDGYALLRFSEP